MNTDPEVTAWHREQLRKWRLIQKQNQLKSIQSPFKVYLDQSQDTIKDSVKDKTG